MNAFLQELVHSGIYKRSQGRIARQVTWVAIAITLALGLWRLSGTLEGWDPNWRREFRAQSEGSVKLNPNEQITIVDSGGRELEKYDIPAKAKLFVIDEDKVAAGDLLCRWDPLANPWARAGLCGVIPGVLLVAGLWVAYRLVNVPAFADFLIAVEAEMNKVSWPTRAELFRSSMVVLITIFFLAAVLFGFDSFWRWFFELLGIFQKKEAAEAALAGFRSDWSVLLIAVGGVF